MRLDDITTVLCLSCALMFFKVSSQPNCSSGWFGHQCKYKCQCGFVCDVSGLCKTHNFCMGGSFGPECQYADLAYMITSAPALTDGNDHTCNQPDSSEINSIIFDELFVFTWLRIRGVGDSASMFVFFRSNNNSVYCPAWTRYAVDKTILDMHCNLSHPINEITLRGKAVPYLCSVYVSGGRNVALRETASQDSVYNTPGTTDQLDACRAVDSYASDSLNSPACARTSDTNSWTLTLSRPRSVHRYVIYNMGGGVESRLIGFQLESFDSVNSSVFVYKDRTTTGKLRYSFIHSPLLVQMVVVTVNNSDKMLALCEVEIYGDSVCDAQHYGRDCEHSCNCWNNDACFVTTGDCPSGCPPGFSGKACMNGTRIRGMASFHRSPSILLLLAFFSTFQG